MPKVECSVEETPDGIEAVCGDCNHCVTIQKVKLTPETQIRILRKMAQTCPHRDGNTYKAVDP